jgi:hypothetical protein
MAPVRIDRLAIEVPGLSPPDAREFALRVAAGLAETHALPAAGDIPTLAVELAADPRAGASLLAERVLGELLRQLARGA